MVLPSFLTTRSPATARVQNLLTDCNVCLCSISSRIVPIGKHLWQSETPTTTTVPGKASPGQTLCSVFRLIDASISLVLFRELFAVAVWWEEAEGLLCTPNL